MSEHNEQVALFSWANLSKNKYPGIELMFAVANGGKRHIGTAIKLKAEGVKPGVPDIFLPVVKGGYFGLFIEMKFGRNKPNKNQTKYLEALKEQGYLTWICYSFEDAKEVIINYYKSNIKKL